MAVNKEKSNSQEETMEAKVDALISGTIDMVQDEEKPTDSDKAPTRRSKRLAKKDKDVTSPKKEKKDKDSSKKEKVKKVINCNMLQI